MPLIYQGESVETLTAQPQIHPNQTKAVRLIKENPDQSFAFIGDFGKGKTHFFYTLFDHAARSGRRVFADTLMSLVAHYQSIIQRSMNGEQGIKPWITGAELRQAQLPVSLFLDDIDKAKPSEYVAQQLFDLVDSAINFRHQLVWTSNLTPDQLAEHFKRADPRYGGAIVRRLLTSTQVVELW